MRPMITDYDQLIAHLKQTGRMKLLPRVLAELKAEATHREKLAPRRETATENPALISGWRAMHDGRLEDHSGKGALVEIYRNVTRHG